MDIFAWQPSDMSGVPRELAEHYLNINPGAKPVKQAMRRFGDKKRRAIGMELAKLLEAGATYQRTMQRCLKDQIGRNVHAYVDDIAVMTRKGSDLINDLKETFDTIHFEATNNMAEYEALLHGLCIAKEIGIKHIICCGDSDLVAQQVAGTGNARNSVMAAYRDEVDEIAKCFLGYEVKYVGRDDNTAAICCLARIRKPIPPFSLSIYGYPQ
ncbi:hypothetical protein QYE76_022804 [Lolium multiflorum]|uniref:RNase H type-1 domain-containing protein n=1 Tax=Lolium multiflorum TaxID=4521 RepID=A0AAD8RA85_LOLMU|nr:hypothetical protein QYE76_022804 [Lolium multiflorum]